MTTKNDEHITSGSMLTWAKRVEVQRSQAVGLDTLTESRQFYKGNISKKTKDDKSRAPVNWTAQQQSCSYCGGMQQLK